MQIFHFLFTYGLINIVEINNAYNKFSKENGFRTNCFPTPISIWICHMKIFI
jgi:hypothetical protein